MDRFLEQVVRKHKRTLNEAAYYVSMVLMVLLGLLALLNINVLLAQFSIAGLIETVLTAGLAALLFFYRDRLRTEFEYSYTNGDLDFAMVLNNQKRKNLGTLKMKGVDAFGKVNSQAFKRYVNMKDVKTDNWFLNREAELYFCYFQKESAKRLIIFEPNEDMVAMIKSGLNGGTWVE